MAGIVFSILLLLLLGCGAEDEPIGGESVASSSQLASASADDVFPESETEFPVVYSDAPNVLESGSRGYLTTPEELVEISRKAALGMEPYETAVSRVIEAAQEPWAYDLRETETCDDDAHTPAWNDNQHGTITLYAKAVTYHLTGEEQYAQDVEQILQRIMTGVKQISIRDSQCPLNFAWGTPELVASADLIEAYWAEHTCTGPTSTLYEETEIASGPCKELFQNWLVKNPYYIISQTAESSTNNWGAAATTTTATIADFLWDRPDVLLIHRNPSQVNDGEPIGYTAAAAYARANKTAIDRMNGYRVDYSSMSACDLMPLSWKQNRDWERVKSQITENGIIPDDARRNEYCNIERYDNEYNHNYPQLHLGNNVQQCELMLRRGDSSCYDNIDNSDIAEFTFKDPNGFTRSTHLYPGRGSIERAINAVIVDADLKWQHDPALEVAYRYYFNNHTSPGFETWPDELRRRRTRCLNHICFGDLTHGFAEDEIPEAPPVVAPPGAVFVESE